MISNSNVDILIELFETRKLKNSYVKNQRYALASKTKDVEIKISIKLKKEILGGDWSTLNDFNRKLLEYLNYNGISAVSNISVLRELKLIKLGI